MDARTIADFGYHFNDAGELRSIKTDEPFVFDVAKGDHEKNQENYEALGEVITEEVYRLLEGEGLQRLYIPEDGDNPKTFIFASSDWKDNSEKLLVLIHGSGVVRAGQWARRLIINEGLDKGTQLPFIRWAKENNYAVLVFNTNQSTDPNGDAVRESETPLKHAEYAWKHFVERSEAKHVAIVAHSAGGHVTVKLVCNNLRDVEKRVFAIALTDSAHAMPRNCVEVKKYLAKVCRDYRASTEPVGTKLDKMGSVPCFSAGHTQHEWTSWSSKDEIFSYFTERLAEAEKKATDSEEEGHSSASECTDKKKRKLSLRCSAV